MITLPYEFVVLHAAPDELPVLHPAVLVGVHPAEDGGGPLVCGLLLRPLPPRTHHPVDGPHYPSHLAGGDNSVTINIVHSRSIIAKGPLLVGPERVNHRF